MRSWVVVFLVSVIALIVIPLTKAYEKNPGDCLAQGLPAALEGNFDSTETKFHWESRARDLGDGRTCFDRLVINRHEKNKLIFDWPTGDMRSFEGVPSGAMVHYNAALPTKFIIRNGPFYYGAGRNSVPTAVYRESERATSIAVPASATRTMT